MAQAEKTSATTSRKPGAGDKSETSDPVMIPLCDVAGYSCFVMWAFVIGWDRNIVPVGVAGFDSYFVLRMALFAGVALGDGMVRLFSGWIGFAASLEWNTILPTLAAATLLGVGFGVAPALRAAQLLPVDALRQE